MLSRLFRSIGRNGGDEGIFVGAFESLAAPRLITDPDGNAVYANSAFCRMIEDNGARPLEALQARLQSDEETADALNRLRVSAATGTSAHAEVRIRTDSGRVEWRSISADALRDRPGFILWSLEDITARREIEQVIGDEQRKLFDFLENAPVGFYSVDRDGHFLFINHTLAEWLGSSPDEIIGAGLCLHDFVLEELAPGTPAHDPFGTDREVPRGEVTLRGRQGRVFQADISQSIVRADNGEGLRTRSVVRDLTPEREMEQALRQSEHRFQKFFEDAPVGIALLDSRGRVVECNHVFRDMLRRADLTGTPLVELIDEADSDEVSARLEQAVAGAGTLLPIEVRIDREAETVVSLYVSRMEERGGETSGLILHALDTTEQKNLEIQFAHSQKMQAVGQLAGGIAHDFNNLLTAMIGFCDLLLLRHRAGDQSFADLMHIKNNANRAANLVRQLLAFSRQQTLQPKVLNITDVLAEFTHLLRRLIGENIKLKMVHGRDLGLVRCDQGQFEQVVINLAVNARDAMLSGGMLAIQTSNVSRDETVRLGHELVPAGDYVLIEVSDTGQGIPSEDISRIFEPFFSTKEVGSGTGLGLSTVYGIVKQTGGSIVVDSEVNVGTKFSIFLPCYREEVPKAEEQKDSAGGEEARRDLSGVGTVLLVEDEDPVRMFGARALRNKGYKVYEAKTGAAALDVMSEAGEPIDLLITDVIMPEMDGPALIRQVRARAPETKIICISGYAEDSFRQRLDRSSDIHFLPKPFSLNQLAGIVKEVMRAGG